MIDSAPAPVVTAADPVPARRIAPGDLIAFLDLTPVDTGLVLGVASTRAYVRHPRTLRTVDIQLPLAAHPHVHLWRAAPGEPCCGGCAFRRAVPLRKDPFGFNAPPMATRCTAWCSNGAGYTLVSYAYEYPATERGWTCARHHPAQM